MLAIRSTPGMTAAPERIQALRRRAAADDTRRATALIRELLRGNGPDPGLVASLLETTPPDVILDLARFHGVSGLLCEPLRSLGGAAEDLLAPLCGDLDASVHRHLRSTWELSTLKPIFDGTGVAWAVVKGPAAVELLYRGSGGRPYQDLDLLVDPSGFRRVVASLEEHGLEPLDRNWAVLRREMRGEVHYRGPAQVEVDLHWNLVNMYRGRMRIPSAELLRRAVSVELAGVEVQTLDPTDSLIHLCLHAAISGGDRVLWLKDIERAISVRPPAWDELGARARRWNVAAPVGLLLARSAHFLDAPVPPTVVAELVSPGTRRLIRAVNRLSPWPRALGRLASPNRLLARSIGQGPVRAPLWLVVRSIRNLDPGQEHASSAFTPGGTTNDRAAFIDAVESSEADSAVPPPA